MTALQNRRILLAAHPDGRPLPSDFRTETVQVPEPGDGELLLEILYLSLDPYMRTRMNAGATYAESVPLGGVMLGATVARVRHSRHPDWRDGDIVLSYSGWQEYAISDGSGLRRIDPSVAPISTALGVLGMTGFTAYVGLEEIGRPVPGETVVVAAASGAVGSIVGQIARIRGARAVGIAGGAAKCSYVKDELGFDAVIDHRAPDFAEQLRAACPDGIDVYFENVGGKVLEAVKPLLNQFARIPVCGLISQYSDQATDASISLSDTLFKSLTVRGFIQTDFIERHQAAFLEQAAQWIKDGELRWREDVVDGLDSAPAAFIGMLDGQNFGKLVVRVRD
ncbi:NADP-dependent oxidoreductase [Massilia sp.]|uniref:NADP-dependent oxidoreductase n=1 Tax=Massilia sp. TaxID=1882437 RepID=UPI00289DC9B1|nr:NADP-dependent oxidoreductase [Massilia sp.]